MNQESSRANPLALLGVFIGAAGFAGSLTAVYLGMREIMTEVGGACASGGPYVVAAECPEGATTMLVVGIFAMIAFGGLFFAATGWHGAVSTIGVALLMWGALFGALGWNFISLSMDPPEFMQSTGGWIVSGVVFWMMALGGLIPGFVALFNSLRGRDEFGQEESATAFSSPIVRANVNFERNMPGDPAFGMSDPSDIARTEAGQPPKTPRVVDTADEFIDPVTGEKIKPGDGS